MRSFWFFLLGVLVFNGVLLLMPPTLGNVQSFVVIVGAACIALAVVIFTALVTDGG